MTSTRPKRHTYRPANRGGVPSRGCRSCGTPKVASTPRLLRSAAIEEASGRVSRAKVLPASVDILLAAGDISTARFIADELCEIATDLDTPLIDAVATQARGGVLPGEDDPRAAIYALRAAGKVWQLLKLTVSPICAEINTTWR